ncbi:XdhC family protein [Aeribacillus alveayuensis]|uniref:Xanthine/CO dehydrogenase XdhC/CoxF family maturation factor n=1 Tax=Aeribacillus alveayuensis TaxID=279215 RepID=A0ABT9VRX6_9BACI|nr:xanthine/CO dehydrogenase XdhC/CoxF family maturation factor [Bacillus alveayuensis]
MNDNKRIVDEILENGNKLNKAAIATVVRVKGSAYKREGAKMLIDESGNTTGLISGGCLEPDVAEAAKQVIENGKPVLRRYDMDEDLVWGLGLGCPGTVDIYIEKINFDKLKLDRSIENFSENPLIAWLSCVKEEKMGVLATIFDQSPRSHTGQKQIFVSENYQTVGKLDNNELHQFVCDFSKNLLQSTNPKSETKTFTLSNGEKVDVFFDVNIPPIELIIFGAGHDAIPLAEFSVRLGFNTTVVDPRSAYLTEARFPGAKRILADASSIPEKVNVSSKSYVVIMNHHLERDINVLKHILNTDARYIGILGPRSRCQKIFKALQIDDIDQYDHIFNPVGLDIGSESPQEIALSILAEIIAFRNKCAGGFLREKKRPSVSIMSSS